jgi:thiamine-monophosphate kinase
VSTPAAAIGHKALAVNLSDLAAMGAEPAWVTLSLTLPDSNPVWLEDFSQGFFHLAGRFGVSLVGGDTSRGPLSVTVQAHGFVPAGRALQRSGAQPGDRVYTTGTLGDAGLALHSGDQADNALRRRLDYPEPRIEAGLVLRDYASAAIDISDGLLADLGHLLETEGAGLSMGAAIHVDALPRSALFTQMTQQPGFVQQDLYYALPLSAGDDYELCFTVPPDSCEEMAAALSNHAIACTAIGIIEQPPGIRCLKANGELYRPAGAGYQHFGDSGGG